MIKKLDLDRDNYKMKMCVKINELVDAFNEITDMRSPDPHADAKEMKAWTKVGEAMDKKSKCTCNCSNQDYGECGGCDDCPVHGASYAPEGYVSSEDVAIDVATELPVVLLAPGIKKIEKVLDKYTITRKKD